ncbi:MAG: hypothetical protein JSS09_06370, partial [Verrucomicrobia bacterium]|nr:hypothetical protein [Verrucomicrobiota bacterium]
MLKSIISFCLLSISCFGSSLEEMTIEEKVGQLFIVCFKGEEANEDSKTLIQKLHVGGIIYYDWANGLYSPKQVLALSSDLQKLTLNNR